MQTLELFLKDKTLPVKIRDESYNVNAKDRSAIWEEIHYLDDEGIYRGHDANREPVDILRGAFGEWSLYTPSKEKVKMYKWAFKGLGNNVWHESTRFHKNEDHFRSSSLAKFTECMRLEHMIEVPSDD